MTGVRVFLGGGGGGEGGGASNREVLLLKAKDLVDRNTNGRATQPQPCISYLKACL